MANAFPFAAAALLLALSPPAQAPAGTAHARPVAFTNARILTMAGPAIERGTLVARDGKITAVGADVAAPAGARIVDCEGGTLMPGLVSAFSRAGLAARPHPQAPTDGGRRGRRGRRAAPEAGPGIDAENRAATKVVEALDPKQDVFGELLEAGVTTLALTPPGNGFPGLGATLRPDGRSLDELTDDDDAFVFVGVARDSKVKKVLKEGFEAARKIVEERHKPKADTPDGAAKPDGADKPEADKPAPKGGDEPKPDDKPQPDKPQPDKPQPEQPAGDGDKPAADKSAPARAHKPDPNLEVLADLLEGKRRAVMEIGSAADLLHWIHACGDDLEFPRAVAATRFDGYAGTFDMVVDQVKKLKAPLLLPPDLSTRPRSRLLTNPARTLHDAGIEVGFVLGDDADTLRTLFFRLMQLVRTGLPRDVALRGVTVVPSKVLGKDAETGSLEVGKKADLLLFSGDPLDPGSALQSVWLGGQLVETETPRR